MTLPFQRSAGGALLRLSSIAILLGLAFLGGIIPFVPGLAQTTADSRVRIVDVDDSSFPTIRIVLEAEVDGRPAPALEPADLVVREEGAPATVTSVREVIDASIPLAVVIALDVSGSVSGDTLASSQDAATSLLDSLDEGDSAALVSFARAAQLTHPLSADKDAIASAVRGLVAAGDTALYDAVVLSAEVAVTSPATRRAVVLLSDGEDFGGISTASRDDSLARAATSGVVFYVIGVGSEVDRPYLEALAQRTGGKYYSAPVASELGGIYASLSELLRSQFVVEIESSAPPSTGSRNLTLSLVRDTVTTVSIDYQSRQTPPTATPEPVTPSPTAPPPSPTSSPTPAPATSEDESGGATGGLIIAVVAMAVVATGGATSWVIWRRRNGPTPPPLQPVDTQPVSRREEMAVTGGAAALIADGRVFTIPGDLGPFTAGTSPDCLLQLPDHESIAAIHARLWWRDGRLMVHHVAPGVRTLVNGQAIEWVSLVDGDEVTIGPNVLLYRAGGL